MNNITRLRSLFWSAASVAATIAVMIMLVVVITPPANAETPAERCKRETAAYNNAWKNTWAQANPGKKPSQAPPPPVPYKCGRNDQAPPEIATPERPGTSTPDVVEPEDPTVDSRREGPALNPPTERSEPATGVDPDQPAIGDDTGAPATRLDGTTCKQALVRLAKRFDPSLALDFSCSGQELTARSGSREFLANIATEKQVELTGFDEAARARARSDVALASNNLDPRLNGYPCDPTNGPGEPRRQIIDTYHSRMVTTICFGTADVRSRSGQLVQVVWSEELTFELRLNLVGMQVQHLTLTNLNTSRRQLGVEVSWRARQHKSPLQEDRTSDEGLFLFPIWGSNSSERNLVYTDVPGIYFIEQMSISIDDLATAKNFKNHEKFKMPRFNCPKSGACKYPYGKEA